MKGPLQRALTAMIIVWLAAVTCSVPTATPPVMPIRPQQDVPGTATAYVLTAEAGAAPAAGSLAQAGTATTCPATVRANLNANIRSGPGTEYGTVGALSQGATAVVAGKNDSDTWWYIEYADAAGGHAWIAKSVTTSACIPEGLLVVAAEAPPVEEQAAQEQPAAEQPAAEEPAAEEPAQAVLPDLTINSFTITPATPTVGQPVSVQVTVYNHGKAAAGPFVVAWFATEMIARPSCIWDMDGCAAGGGRVLKCHYTFAAPISTNQVSFAFVDQMGMVWEGEEGEDNNQASISPFRVLAP